LKNLTDGNFMEVGKVIGQLVTTVRDPKLPHCSLLLVELCDTKGPNSKFCQGAADPIGAGNGEWVLLTRGSSARKGLGQDVPVDLCIVGIVDEITLGEKVLYSKMDNK
jgi:ethanolamine utilization protein EutN